MNEPTRCEWVTWSPNGVEACSKLAAWHHHVGELVSNYCDEHKCPKCVT
jgi:hypothetical protein